MQATIIQTPEGLEFRMPIPSFPNEGELKGLYRLAIKEATARLVEETLAKAINEAACVRVFEAAELLSIKTVATVRGFSELNPKHPKHLPIIPGTTAASDLVSLSELKAWVSRNSKPDALRKITEYEAKNATK